MKIMFNTFLLEYSKLENRWDIKWYIWMLESVFPMQKLWKYIKERSEKVKLNNSPKETFSILWVNNKVGVVDTYDELWKNINQSYKKVETNDITYNPYRVNVWSIWIVKPWLKWNYISPAYVVFHCNEKHLSTEYLHLILSSDWFNETLRANTSGSVRQNLTFDLLSSLEIPLPPLDIQAKIVKTYNDIKNEIEDLENENKNLEKEVDKYLMKELWIEIEQKDKKKFFCVGYEDLDRWDINFNLSNKIIESAKFNIFSVKNISSWEPLYWSNKPSVSWNKEKDYRYIRITDIDEKWNLKDDIWVTVEKFEEKYVLKENDFLIARTWWTIWKTFLYKEKFWKAVYAWYLIKFSIDNNKIIPEFLYQITRSNYYKNWLRNLERFAWQPNINAKEFLSFSFPLPDINIQKQILNWIDKIKNKLNQDRIEKLKVDLDEKIKGMILEGKYL